MPSIVSRDQVTVEGDKTELVQIQQTDSKGNLTGTTEQVYAYASGTSGTTEKTSEQNSDVTSDLALIAIDSNNEPGEKAYNISEKEDSKEEAIETVLKEEITGKATSFAGGTGTESDPFLIKDYGTMQLIDSYYEKGYFYYKVDAESLTNNEIDLKFWEPVRLYGSFDGSGAVLNNLDDVLFKWAWNDRDDEGNPINVCSIKNVTLNCSIFGTGSAAGLIRTAADDMVVDNVNIHGQIVGYSVGGYVDYGSGNWGNAKTRNWQITFKNCINDAKLVSYGEGIGGFVQHPYCDMTNGDYATSKSCITIEDSAFIGKMTSVSDNMDYFAYQGNDVRIKESYTNKFEKKYGEISGVLHKECEEDSKGYIDCGNYSPVNDRYRPNDSTNSTFKLKITNSGSTPSNYGEKYSLTKVEGATTCKVSYMISPNDAVNESGSYTSTYMKETINVSELDTDEVFNTNKISYCKAVINGDGVVKQGLSADGKTYNVYDGGKFLGHTHNGASVYAVQYDEAGDVVGITTITVESSNAVGIRVNGNSALSAGAGCSYTFDTKVDLSNYDVSIKIYSRTVSTWCWDYTEDAVYKTLTLGTDYTIDGSKIVINNIELVHLTNETLYNYFHENCRYVISYTTK